MQLPNWWEFVVTAFACSKIGAVMNPVMPILRERELVYILNFCKAKVFIVPKSYRGFDYAAMAQGMRGDLPDLQHVIVVDGDGPDSFERALLASDPGKLPPGLAPDDMAVLMFTSGTTGEPKGVMHTSNSLIACCKALSGRFGLDSSDVLLVASPVGHMTGYAAIVLLSVYLGGTMILQDVWEAKHGVSLMASEGVTYTAASTPFLSDICEAVKAGAPHPKDLRSFLCGGAPIPSVLIERAANELGLTVCSLWGMTEILSGTLTEPSRAGEKSATTDGRAQDGMEVRIVDLEGRPVPAGQSGRLLVRGAQMFKGYYKRPELQTFDSEGWFDSGDLAYMDEDGYIRISGRVKDILIRGGENVPVVEVENLLYKHPAVAAVALVGFPDARLGERGCAFIVPRPGSTIDLATVQAYSARLQDGETVLAGARRGHRRPSSHRQRQDPEVQAERDRCGVCRNEVAQRRHPSWLLIGVGRIPPLAKRCDGFGVVVCFQQHHLLPVFHHERRIQARGVDQDVEGLLCQSQSHGRNTQHFGGEFEPRRE